MEWSHLNIEWITWWTINDSCELDWEYDCDHAHWSQVISLPKIFDWEWHQTWCAMLIRSGHCDLPCSTKCHMTRLSSCQPVTRQLMWVDDEVWVTLNQMFSVHDSSIQRLQEALKDLLSQFCAHLVFILLGVCSVSFPPALSKHVKTFFTPCGF